MRRVAIVNHTARSGRGHFGCETVMRVLEEALTRRGWNIAVRVPVTVDWRKLDPSLFDDVDAIVVNGEGSIHHTATRVRVAGLAQLGAHARDKLGVPAYLINATLYELDEPALAGIAGFDRVFVRDSASLNELVGHRIEADVVPDLTLGFDFPQSAARQGFAVTDSVLPEATKKLQRIGEAQVWPYIRIKPQPETEERPAIQTAEISHNTSRHVRACLRADFTPRRSAWEPAPRLWRWRPTRPRSRPYARMYGEPRIGLWTYRCSRHARPSLFSIGGMANSRRWTAMWKPRASA